MTPNSTASLPDSSSASINSGMWYVFRDGESTIRAWGSSWAGLERVYFDAKPIQKYSSTSRQQRCSFSQNGQRYEIRCTAKHLQRWQVECELWKNGRLLQTIKCQRRKLWNVRPAFAHLWLGIGAGLLGGILKMPWWFGLVFIFASLTTTLLTTAKTVEFLLELEET